MTRADVLSARPAWLHVLVGLGLVAVFAVGPAWVQTPVTAVILIIGMVALHIGPRRNLAPADRTPWRLLRLGGYIFIFVSLIRGIWPATVASPPTSLTLIPDTLILPAYLCVGYAYMVMLRRRRAGDDDPARVDAVLVGLAGASSPGRS